MPVRVKYGTVRHNGETYISNDVISGLSEKEESRLISLGAVEITKEVREVKGINKDENPTNSDSEENSETTEPANSDTSNSKPEVVSDSSDNIDIKFDPAAYVGDAGSSKKTKAGK